ncbi:MAG: nuclear transport factor 2 family protein [Acidobacteriota bacterium]|nr:nuclear transport factor 2 family protein [Acidobacteriota bacterium]
MLPDPRTTRRSRLVWPAGALLGVCLLSLVCASFARGDAPHRKRKEFYKGQVEQLEQVWRTAQLAGDVPEMDKLLAEDYVGITMTGQVVTKMQQLERLRSRELVLTRIDLDDVKVKLIGTTAIVTSLANIDGTNDGAAVHGTYRYTRVYTRLPSGVWKITSSEATRVGPPSVSERRSPAAEPHPE